MSLDPPRSVIVVPAKPATVAKTRLADVPIPVRIELAVAFATDTVSACLAAELVDGVVVITEEQRLRHLHDDARCIVAPDGPVAGLNPALRHGADIAGERWPGRRVVALLADLPSLRAADLDAVLARGLDGSWFVPDADGVGTTALSAAFGSFDPHFGVESARAHASSGAQRLSDAPPRLRHDVDDLDALHGAMAFGVGAATAAVLHLMEGEIGSHGST
ncbi:2-phospho-L-lactate guanylyltransferase [Nocardioides sp. R-C-SC26]|uniref:2-phospho-L-lactate guanylyltransferase n=1 Tax=Nocardioides sp. R-C-SC26 TaxID=2870414 RepID=UPI001E453E63|nr:2-phospho-L-lactate guanylyltransferase [Nocardioides sp. R-C-SC26]